MELHLHQGELRALFMDGFPVREALRVQDVLRQLMKAASGRYEFEAAAPDQLTNHFSLPLNTALRGLVEDARIDEAQLPHVQTVFEVQPRAEDLVGSLPATLQGSWPLLRQVFQTGGGNAAQVSERLHISVEEARLMLFQLRAAGIVVPVRAAGNVAETVQVSAPTQGGQVTAPSIPAPAPATSPVGRFLNALRRLTGRS
ncbi:hypothetical protein ACFP81_13140 [Deinococcus lacus]|uniref:DUF4388 domain-containing protein n=1 Tax=Deinococcus lacus TaxID=392561 RepID=A0ABW1YI34_9DEIO